MKLGWLTVTLTRAIKFRLPQYKGWLTVVQWSIYKLAIFDLYHYLISLAQLALA